MEIPKQPQTNTAPLDMPALTEHRIESLRALVDEASTFGADSASVETVHKLLDEPHFARTHDKLVDALDKAYAIVGRIDPTIERTGDVADQVRQLNGYLTHSDISPAEKLALRPLVRTARGVAHHDYWKLQSSNCESALSVATSTAQKPVEAAAAPLDALFTGMQAKPDLRSSTSGFSLGGYGSSTPFFASSGGESSHVHGPGCGHVHGPGCGHDHGHSLKYTPSSGGTKTASGSGSSGHGYYSGYAERVGESVSHAAEHAKVENGNRLVFGIGAAVALLAAWNISQRRQDPYDKQESQSR